MYPLAASQAQQFEQSTCVPTNAVYNSMYWSPSVSGGAFEVHGCIAQEYIQVLQGPNGFLGFPTSNEGPVWASGSTTNQIGRLNTFQGGTIYYSDHTGAHEVRGVTLAHYLDLGGPSGWLEFPMSDEVTLYSSDGSTRTGTVTPFQNAYIFWCAATNAAWSIHGSIYDEYWNTLKGPNSVLGYPTSDEESVYASDGTTQIGRQNTFQSGTIFFSNYTGAHEVHGPILTKYLSFNGGGTAGGPASFASFPTSDVQPLSGGSVSTFQGAPQVGQVNIYSSSAGAYEVQGSILQKYLSVGGPGSALGFPTSDEHAAANGVDRESDFQNGYIIYSESSGQATIYYT